MPISSAARPVERFSRDARELSAGGVASDRPWAARPIRLATPQPPNPRDQETDFGMNALLGWSHVKLDSMLIIRMQLY
jgi:hypothetical protein